MYCKVFGLYLSKTKRYQSHTSSANPWRNTKHLKPKNLILIFVRRSLVFSNPVTNYATITAINTVDLVVIMNHNSVIYWDQPENL